MIGVIISFGISLLIVFCTLYGMYRFFPKLIELISYLLRGKRQESIFEKQMKAYRERKPKKVKTLQEA